MKINITKRSGVTEQFSIEKIHRVLGWATKDIENVSISDIEMQLELNLYDGISTKEIHSAIVKAAANLISEDIPEYQYVASRLAIYMLRKEVWGESEPPRLLEHIKTCVKEKVYDANILDKYTTTEIHKLNKYLNHDKDYKFTFGGIQQLIDKYLVKNRDSGKIFETPQFAYMLIAMTLFQEYDKKSRLSYVKKCYDYLSDFKINLPTPIMMGVRTNVRQYASCILLDCDDTIDSIFATASAIGHYTSQKAGIGVNVSRIRALGSSIRGGEVIHTGIIPFLKVFEATTKSCSQGARGGSATANIQFWHKEIEDVVVLKNNAGTDDNRVRKLDYVVQFDKTFYDKVVKNEDIVLFSPNDVPELIENFGLEKFNELYEQATKNLSIKNRKKIPARQLLEVFTKERLETGRIYVMNIDHANYHSPFKDRVTMVNLCVEITHPTIPVQTLNDENGEVGVCILSAVNLLETQKNEFEDVCDIIVRSLDNLIDYQSYPIKAAENFCKKRRSLGVGITNFAALLAKNSIDYNSQEAIDIAYEYGELLQYYLLKSSNQLAIEKGPCAKFDRTKYSDGILPLDTANQNVPTTKKPVLDWETLREKIQTHGLRNSTVTAQMPAESSSVIQNSTNGDQPVRQLITYKRSKYGNIKQVAPNSREWKYTLAFDCKNTSLTNITSAFQAWYDMSISMNHYYDYSKYPNEEIPQSELIKDMFYAYKLGIKTIYYTNTKDIDSEKELNNCESGACAI